MNLAQFDRLGRRDFENGGVISEIRDVFKALAAERAKVERLREALRNIERCSDSYTIQAEARQALSSPPAEVAKPGLIPARCRACGEVMPAIVTSVHFCPQGEAAGRRAFDVGYDAQGNVAGTKPAEPETGGGT